MRLISDHETLLQSLNVQPKFKNGTPFYEYNQHSRHTDFTSAGQANAKFKESVVGLYDLERCLMANDNYIRDTVTSDSSPFEKSRHLVNDLAFLVGKPERTTSSLLPSFSEYDSNITTVNTLNQNPTGFHTSYIRTKKRVPAYVQNGKVNIQALKDSFKETKNGKITCEVPMRPIPFGLYVSPHNNNILMPIHPEYPDKDVSISVFHNNNSATGQFPSNEFAFIVRTVLPNVNSIGFMTAEQAKKFQDRLVQTARLTSSKILVADFVIAKLDNQRFYVLPAFD